MTREATDVHIRFRDEQNNIRAFVSVTDEFMRPNDITVARINAVLVDAGFVSLPMRPQERTGQPFSDHEFQTIIDSMDSFEGPISNKIYECDKELAYLHDQTSKVGEAIGTDNLNRLAQWLRGVLKTDPKTGLHDMNDNYAENLFAELAKQNPELSTSEYAHTVNFHYLRDLAKAKRVGSISVRLDLVRETFNRIRVAHRMRDPSADVNILRQGFLLLMTAFDAAAFDMVRVAMRHQFFRLIARFGKKETIPIKEWDRFATVHEFQTRMIERSLKGFYLKDLLEVIRGMGVKLTKDDEDGIKLTEAIQRRNLHVHNRGFVDERYLETDEKGKPKYNIFDLTPGEMAVIDDHYFARVLRVTSECIQLLQEWVVSGAPTKKE